MSWVEEGKLQASDDGAADAFCSSWGRVSCELDEGEGKGEGGTCDDYDFVFEIELHFEFRSRKYGEMRIEGVSNELVNEELREIYEGVVLPHNQLSYRQWWGELD